LKKPNNFFPSQTYLELITNFFYSFIFKIKKATFDLYESDASSTHVPNNRNFSISYGDGTQITGFLSQDTLQIAEVTVKNQIFAEATQFDLTAKYDVILKKT